MAQKRSPLRPFAIYNSIGASGGKGIVDTAWNVLKSRGEIGLYQPTSAIRHRTLSFNVMPYIISGIALIVVWAIAIVFYQTPGWIHLLLTAGVSLWVYGVVKPKAALRK